MVTDVCNARLCIATEAQAHYGICSPATTTTCFTILSDVKVFALSASVLYVKFLASTMIQGRKAFAANTRMPEDKALVCNMGIKLDADDKAVKCAMEDEMRWKRIIQNDLESMPLAFVVFWAAISVGVNPTVTKTLMMAYTSARVGHTAVYSLGMPQARMACWMAGALCVVAAAANAVVAALM